MNTKDVAQAVEEWASEVTGFSHYEHMPTSILKALPLVICEIQQDQKANRNQELPDLTSFQQAYVRARTVELSLMLYPEDSWTASQGLYDAVDKLADSLRADPKLGGRVFTSSPFYQALYTPPESAHADGTVARVARFQMTVGELVEVG